ncbi:MAG: amino acid permease [Candidatus Omnitrophota bacterium]
MSEKRFGAFEGVFTPTFLSILGIIMYLRLGWVVGSVGLMNALAIIVMANLITLFTCLSVASIATNMRIGTGGAYSIISKSLGLEIGGAIGIPLYLSQAISVAFYITGFSECWTSVFPGHGFILVSLCVWLVLLIISYTSAKLAFRLQYIIIAIIILSLVSFFLGKSRLAGADIPIFRPGAGATDFWRVFAIFFPAVTGILAGLSMSGELKKPERDIPFGILTAVVVTFAIYILIAFRFAYAASSQDLVSDTAIIIQLGRWRALIIAGIMGATLSSALSMFVASPRTLLALGKYGAVPLSRQFARVDRKSEPTTAILFTAFLALFTIAIGTLNRIAGLLTMFFLVTYGMLNFSVFVERIIGIPSFRPKFRVSWVFPLLGGIGCVAVMFLINAVFSIAAIVIIIAIYFILIHRQVRKNWPDVRKGFFIFVAEQALKIAINLPYHPKSWKPNLLIPVSDPRSWTGIMDFVRAIVYPSGRVNFFRIAGNNTADCGAPDESADRDAGQKRADGFEALNGPLIEEGILVSSAVVRSDDFPEAAAVVSQSLRNSLLPPNVFFLKLGMTPDKDGELLKLVERVKPLDLGLVVFILHPKIGLGQKKAVNLWIREGSPNIDLAVLVALQLEKNWDAKIRLVQVAGDEGAKENARQYLMKLRKMTRIPADAEICVLTGSFEKAISAPPPADMNIFGLAEELSFTAEREIAGKVNTSAVFLRDSKRESAFV